MSINPAALEVYREIMRDETDAFIADILDSFYTNARELINSLDKALDKNDVEGFVRAAHTLKTTSATVGAQRVSNLIADLETRGEKEPLLNLQPLVVELWEAYEEAEKKLKEFYAS